MQCEGCLQNAMQKTKKTEIIIESLGGETYRYYDSNIHKEFSLGIVKNWGRYYKRNQKTAKVAYINRDDHMELVAIGNTMIKEVNVEGLCRREDMEVIRIGNIKVEDVKELPPRHLTASYT